MFFCRVRELKEKPVAVGFQIRFIGKFCPRSMLNLAHGRTELPYRENFKLSAVGLVLLGNFYILSSDIFCSLSLPCQLWKGTCE